MILTPAADTGRWGQAFFFALSETIIGGNYG